MLLAIILIYNLIIGVLINQFLNNKKNGECKDFPVWVRGSMLSLKLLVVGSYLFQLILAMTMEYKMMIGLDMIAIFSLFALVQINKKK